MLIKDRVKERVQVGAGTGNVTVIGAPTGFRTFASAGLSVGDTFYYAIEGPLGAYEVGVGTVVSTGVLARTTVVVSSSGGATINIGASGQYFIFITQIADKIVSKDLQGRVIVGAAGLVFNNGTTQTAAAVTPDLTPYLTSVTAASTYLAKAGGTMTGALSLGTNTLTSGRVNFVDGSNVVSAYALYTSGVIAMRGADNFPIGITCSSISCDSITSYGRVLIQDPTNGVNAFCVTTASATEIVRVDATNRTFIAGGDAFAVRSSTGGAYLFNNGFLAATNSSNASSAVGDTFQSRASAGVWRFGTTSTGSDAGIQCGAVTASGNLNLNGAYHQFYNAGFGLGVRRTDNSAFLWGMSLSQGFLVADNYGIGFANGADSAPTAKIMRSATGPTVDSCATGGFRSRNLANSADAPLTAGAITASGTVIADQMYVGSGNVLEVNTLGAGVNSSGYFAWSNGSNAGSSKDTRISRLSAGVVQIGTTAANALGSLNCATVNIGSSLLITSGVIRPAFSSAVNLGSGFTASQDNFANLHLRAAGAVTFGTQATINSPSASLVQIGTTATNALGSLACANAIVGGTPSDLSGTAAISAVATSTQRGAYIQAASASTALHINQSGALRSGASAGLCIDPGAGMFSIITRDSAANTVFSVSDVGTMTLGGTTINPANGAITIGQTFGITMSTSNAFVVRHGRGDTTMVRTTDGIVSTFSPAGYGALSLGNGSNAIGAYFTIPVAGTLAIRNAAHGDAALMAGAITASGPIQETPRQSSLAPTTTDIPSGKSQRWYNSTSGEFNDYINIGGTLLTISGGGLTTTQVRLNAIIFGGG